RDGWSDGGAALGAERGSRSHLNQATRACGQSGDLLRVVTGARAQATGRAAYDPPLPVEFVLVLLKAAGGAVLADGRHADDDLCTLLDRLTGAAHRGEIGGGEAGFDGV